MHNRVRTENLPKERVVVQFDFTGHKIETYWLVLSQRDVTICLTDPGYEITVLVNADLATFFKVWLGRVEYHDALETPQLCIDGLPRHTRAFPQWFAWSPAADIIRQRGFAG